MLIDWFTVIAQALNFFILVWLMKHFLYKPIRLAIDEREKRIAAELANADKKKLSAKKESDEFKEKNKVFDQERVALLKKATEEAQAERERLLDEMRKADIALNLKRQESLRSEENNLHQAISRLAQKEVFAISRQALTDLAGADLEERMVDIFIRRLNDLSEKDKGQLRSTSNSSHIEAIIRTTVNLPEKQRTSTEDAIKAILGKDTPVQFKIAPELISGIELTTNGQKVAWSIADYLSSLQKNVDELLKEKVKPEVTSAI